MSSLSLTDFSEEQKIEILEETDQLGDAQPPESLSSDGQSEVMEIFDLAFIHTYQTIGLICSTLAFLSSLIVWVMVKPKKS